MTDLSKNIISFYDDFKSWNIGKNHIHKHIHENVEIWNADSLLKVLRWEKIFDQQKIRYLLQCIFYGYYRLTQRGHPDFIIITQDVETFGPILKEILPGDVFEKLKFNVLRSEEHDEGSEEHDEDKEYSYDYPEEDNNKYESYKIFSRDNDELRRTYMSILECIMKIKIENIINKNLSYTTAKKEEQIILDFEIKKMLMSFVTIGGMYTFIKENIDDIMRDIYLREIDCISGCSIKINDVRDCIDLFYIGENKQYLKTGLCIGIDFITSIEINMSDGQIPYLQLCYFPIDNPGNWLEQSIFAIQPSSALITTFLQLKILKLLNSDQLLNAYGMYYTYLHELGHNLYITSFNVRDAYYDFSNVSTLSRDDLAKIELNMHFERPLSEDDVAKISEGSLRKEDENKLKYYLVPSKCNSVKILDILADVFAMKIFKLFLSNNGISLETVPIENIFARFGGDYAHFPGQMRLLLLMFVFSELSDIFGMRGGNFEKKFLKYINKINLNIIK